MSNATSVPIDRFASPCGGDRASAWVGAQRRHLVLRSIAILFGFFLLTSSSVLADQVRVTSFESVPGGQSLFLGTLSASSTSGEKRSLAFNLGAENRGSAVLTGLRITYSLCTFHDPQEVVTEFTVTGDRTRCFRSFISSNAFSLAPGEKSVQQSHFEYTEEPFAGALRVIATVMDEDSLPIAMTWAEVSPSVLVGGRGRPLNIEETVLLHETRFPGTTYFPLTGLVYEKGETPVGALKVRNFTNAEIRVTPRIRVYRRNHAGGLSYEAKGEPFSVAPAGVTQARLTFRADLPPQSYLVEAQLFDEQNVAASDLIHFRYVIRGRAASIQRVRLSKSAALSGETITVDFLALGSPDLSELGVGAGRLTPLNDVTGKVQLWDRVTQSLVGETTFAVTLDDWKGKLSEAPVQAMDSSDALEARIILDSPSGLLRQRNVLASTSLDVQVNPSAGRHSVFYTFTKRYRAAILTVTSIFLFLLIAH
ncbi:MAG: hypothetical protein IT290_12525, partial [Deltaproteobacteria bacterium]|nr:hypothetical protein [Deltaproteobacteria bacterium]